MDQQAEITSIILSSFAAFWETVLGFLPKVIATFLILVVGILLAKAARIVVSRLLQLFRFDQLVEKTGLESYIIGSDYNIRFSGLISGTIYWLIILMMITSIAELLGLQVISDLFEKVLLYLPNIILAMVILIIGTIFSRIVNRYVFNNLKELSMDFALKVAMVAETVVQVFVWFLALEQLQVNTILLLVLFSCLMGAAALAAALAFGLAGQAMAAEILERSRRGIESGIEEGRK